MTRVAILAAVVLASLVFQVRRRRHRDDTTCAVKRITQGMATVARAPSVPTPVLCEPSELLPVMRKR